MKRDLIFILIALLLGILACSVSGDQSGVYRPVTDEFDMVEVNHVYNEYGGHVIDQLIFYNWDRLKKQLRVEAWVMMKNCRTKTKEDEEKFKKERDEYLEKIFRDPILKQKARENIEYKGVYIGGPSAPRIVHEENIFICKFSKNDVDRLIICRSMIETHSDYDRERRNRELFPESQRYGFTKKEDINFTVSHPTQSDRDRSE